jgi:hypothetical protein
MRGRLVLLPIAAIAAACVGHGSTNAHHPRVDDGIYCDRTRGVVRADREDEAKGIVRCDADEGLECCTSTEPRWSCGDPVASVWTSCLPLAASNAR